MLRRLVDHGEGLLKGVLFDCHRCGQCVLRKTGMVCPMRCPKGLRNGPCGGTVDGRCEVPPERDCMWVKIDGRRHGKNLTTPPILPPIREDLRDRASLLNALSGRDAGCRTPLPPLGDDADTTDPRCRTASQLEARLRGGHFVCTVETRSDVLTSISIFEGPVSFVALWSTSSLG